MFFILFSFLLSTFSLSDIHDGHHKHDPWVSDVQKWDIVSAIKYSFEVNGILSNSKHYATLDTIKNNLRDLDFNFFDHDTICNVVGTILDLNNIRRFSVHVHWQVEQNEAEYINCTTIEEINEEEFKQIFPNNEVFIFLDDFSHVKYPLLSIPQPNPFRFDNDKLNIVWEYDELHGNMYLIQSILFLLKFNDIVFRHYFTRDWEDLYRVKFHLQDHEFRNQFEHGKTFVDPAFIPLPLDTIIPIVNFIFHDQGVSGSDRRFCLDVSVLTLSQDDRIANYDICNFDREVIFEYETIDLKLLLHRGRIFPIIPENELPRLFKSRVVDYNLSFVSNNGFIFKNELMYPILFQLLRFNFIEVGDFENILTDGAVLEIIDKDLSSVDFVVGLIKRISEIKKFDYSFDIMFYKKNDLHILNYDFHTRPRNKNFDPVLTRHIETKNILTLTLKFFETEGSKILKPLVDHNPDIVPNFELLADSLNMRLVDTYVNNEANLNACLIESLYIGLKSKGYANDGCDANCLRDIKVNKMEYTIEDLIGLKVADSVDAVNYLMSYPNISKKERWCVETVLVYIPYFFVDGIQEMVFQRFPSGLYTRQDYDVEARIQNTEEQFEECPQIYYVNTGDHFQALVPK